MNTQTKTQNFVLALVVLTSLFFMWGFITCMNDILIPFVKKMFDLSRTESMLVQFAFFGAYFIGSLIYFIISWFAGDPIAKIGYKNGLIIGLLLSAAGTAMFWPAASMKEYSLFLSALFVLALGFTMLQIAANPYVALLGKPETASSRLNLSQAFNSFGTAIAPIIGGYLVFHYFAQMGDPLLDLSGAEITTDNGSPMSALGVQLPYIIFSGVFVLLSIIIKITPLPKVVESTSVERGAGALKYPHLIFGMIAIFMYVGGEVSIGSVLINFMGEQVGMAETDAKSYLALYWGGAMIGRFLGAISLSDKTEFQKNTRMVLAMIAAFAFLFFVINIENGFELGLSKIWPFTIFLVLNFIGFKIGKSMAGRTLMIFAIANTALLLFTLLSNGMASVWTLLGIGLFNSIMWSNIFTLAIKGLGKYTAQGSSLLVMMILGGALLPPLQGFLADKLDGYHYSFIIPAISYLYLTFYGWKGYKVGLK